MRLIFQPSVLTGFSVQPDKTVPRETSKEDISMQPIIKFLRGLGSFGAFLANALVFLTTSWVLVMSALGSLWIGLSDWGVNFIHNPNVQAVVIVFLVVLWSAIGILVLIDRQRPRIVRSYQDYQYGLTYEGLVPIFEKDNEDGALQFVLQLRNYSMGPIRYSIEHFDVRIGSRALPEWRVEGKTVYMPRGAARSSGAIPFRKDDIKEFYEKRVNGTAKFSVSYGHPETQPVRRSKITLELIIVFNTNMPLGFMPNILEEIDEPFNTH